MKRPQKCDRKGQPALNAGIMDGEKKKMSDDVFLHHEIDSRMIR